MFLYSVLLSLFVGCSKEKVDRYEDASMPEVETIVAEQSIKTPDKFIVMLDYSGSMKGIYENEDATCLEPAKYFYQKPEFSQLITDWLDASLPAKTPVSSEILLFNNRLWSVRTGKKGITKFSKLKYPMSFTNGAPNDFQDWFEKIPTNPKNKGETKAEQKTKTQDALKKVISAVEDEAIIWLLTDNLTDSGASEEAQNNKRFYDELQKNPNIRAVLGYPVNLSDPNSWLCGRSLFVYGIYVAKNTPSDQKVRVLFGEGDTPTSAKSGVLWNNNLATLSKDYSCNKTAKGKALRLKPIDRDVLTVRLNALSVDAVRCEKSITMEDKTAFCTAKITVTNNLNHQIVQSADIVLQNQTLRPTVNKETPSWMGDISPKSMKIEYWTDGDGQKNKQSQIKLTELKPKESTNLSVRFSFTNPKIRHSSLSEIWDVANTSEVRFDGDLYVTVKNIKTSLQTDPKDITCISRGEDIPQIFEGQATSNEAHAKESIRFKLKNSGKEMALFLVTGIALLIGGFLFFAWKYRSIAVDVQIDENPVQKKHQLLLPRLSKKRVSIDDISGAEIIIKRGTGKGFSVLAGSNSTLEPYRDGYHIASMDDPDTLFYVKVERPFGETPSSLDDEDDF